MGIQIADIYASAHFKDEGLLAGLQKAEAGLEDVSKSADKMADNTKNSFKSLRDYYNDYVKSGWTDRPKTFEEWMPKGIDQTKYFGDAAKEWQEANKGISSEIEQAAISTDELGASTEKTKKKFIDFSVMGQRLKYQMRQFGVDLSALPVPLMATGIGAYLVGKQIAKSVNYTAEWSQEIKTLDKSMIGAGKSMNAFEIIAADTFLTAKKSSSSFGEAVQIKIGNYVIPILNKLSSGFNNLTKPLTDMWDNQNRIIDSTLKTARTYDEWLDMAIDQSPYYQSMERAWGLEKARAEVSREYTREMYNQVKAQNALTEAGINFNKIMKQGYQAPSQNIFGQIGGMGGYSIFDQAGQMAQDAVENWKIFEKYGTTIPNIMSNLSTMMVENPKEAARVAMDFAAALAVSEVELGNISKNDALKQLKEQLHLNNQQVEDLFNNVGKTGGALKAFGALEMHTNWYIHVIFVGGGAPGGGWGSGPITGNTIFGIGIPKDVALPASGLSNFLVPSYAQGGSFIVPRGYSGLSSGYPMMVHSGERVNVDTASKTQVDNDALLSELQGMRSELATLKTSIRDAVLMAV